MSGAANPLLDVDSVVPYAWERGILSPAEPAEVVALSGGVSNVVLRIQGSSDAVVLKQALERLAVADDWFADPGRSQVEADAITVLSELTPDRVPRLIDADPARCTVTIECAPPTWVPWKSQLMAGVVSPGVAGWLGSTLRAWHEATLGLDTPSRFDGHDLLRQLRLDPYFAVSARRRPQVAAELGAVVNLLDSSRVCLVHGDFSPKNILVDPRSQQGWVIDHEVAHMGHPAFDVAFMVTHLTLKTIHVSAAQEALVEARREFLVAYGDGPGADPQVLCPMVGALLLARVVGSSPVEYLTATEQGVVEDLALRMLTTPPTADWLDA